VLVVTTVRADDQDTIDYRQHIMKGLNAQSAILGQIVAGAVPNDQLAQHLDALASIASTALKSFEPKVAGGESKPAVWNDWADFSKRMNEFSQKAAHAAKLAHAQGPDAAMTSMMEALTCKSCHDVYRTEKK
jgi:cytochrome c556